MAGKKTQRKLNISIDKTNKLFRKSADMTRDAGFASFNNPDTPKVRLAQQARQKSNQALAKTKNLAAKSGRRLGLNIDQKIIATRNNAKRRTGNIVESVDNKRF